VASTIRRFRAFRRPRGGLWRNGDFLRLWSAQTISEFGSQITALALPLAAIVVLGASAFEVAALSTIEFAPYLLFSIPAGVWVDRLPHRPLLIMADLGRAVALASIPIAYAFDALTLSQLYVVGFLAGSLTVVFSLAYAAYLPGLVEHERLVDANAKLQASSSVAQLGGPGTGGGLVAATSAPVAIITDALSFIASALLLSSMRHREPRKSEAASPEPRESWRRELSRGARYALGNPYVRPILLASALANFGLNLIWAILIFYAVRVLDLHAGLVGAILSLGQAGGLLGALSATRISRAVGVGRSMIGAAALFGLSSLLIAAAPRSFPIPVLALGWGIGSFVIVIFNVLGVSLRQAIVPQRLQGRVLGFNRFFVLGVIPLGSLTGGALAASIGLRPAIAVGAIVAGCAFVPLLASRVRTLDTLPAKVEEGPMAPETASPVVP
jgi:MFS family permease